MVLYTVFITFVEVLSFVKIIISDGSLHEILRRMRSIVEVRLYI